MKTAIKKELTWLSYKDMPAKPLLCNKCEEVVMEEEYFDKDAARILRKKKLVTYDPVVELSKYKVSDFLLENLIACGAIANMKTCQFTDNDIDTICANLENASEFIDYLAAREQFNQTNVENTNVEQ